MLNRLLCLTDYYAIRPEGKMPPASTARCKHFLRLVLVFTGLFGLGQAAQAQTFINCGDVYLEVGDENDSNAEQVDCYRVKVPFYLKTEDTSIDTIEAFEVNIAIQFDYKPGISVSSYPPIMVVDSIEIPRDSTFNSGFTSYELSGSNYFFIKRSGGNLMSPAIFEVNQSTPSFYAIVDVRHTSEFEAKVVSFAESPTQFTLVNDGFSPPTTLCEFPDIEIKVNDQHQGPGGIPFCSGNPNADDLRLKVDLDSIITIPSDIGNGVGERKRIPVKLVSFSGDPGTLNFSRLDFRIDYADVEGDLSISTSPLEVPGLESMFPDLNLSESYIGVNLSESDLEDINFIFDSIPGTTNYEVVLFFITVESPTDPPAGGEIEFTEDYARLRYDDGTCCLPQLQGGGTVLLEEFERYCGNNTASYIEISGLSPSALSDNEIGLDVRLFVNSEDANLTTMEFSQLFIEAEIELEDGLTLDELAIETDTSSNHLCPANCSSTAFDYPASGCIEFVPGSNIIRYGFCVPDSLFIDGNYRLFKISGTGQNCSGKIRSIRINRAVWIEDTLSMCVPDVRHNYTEADLTTRIKSKGTVFAHCTESGNLVAGIENVQISECADTSGSSYNTDTDSLGRFEVTDLCNEAGRSLSFSAEKTITGDAANGVSTFDLIMIQRHILGVDLLDEPWQHIAADADNESNIGVIDLIRIRRVVLQMDIDFQSPVKNWDFVGKSYTLPGSPNPFDPSVSPAFHYDSLDCFDFDLLVDGAPDFYAIKKGDVDGSIFGTCDSSENYAGDFEIQGKNNTTPAHTANGQVAIGAIASGSAFSDVLGFQVALRFDTSKLTFDTLLAKDLGDVDDEIYHLDHNEPDLLRISWFAENSTARDLSSTEQAFELLFDRAAGSSLSFSDIWIDSTEMAPELYIERDSMIDTYRLLLGEPSSGFLIAAPGGSMPTAQSATPKLTVMPNPSSGSFTVRALPNVTAPARLQVLDSSGKLILDQETDLSSDCILPAQGWSAGLYLLRTEVDGELYTTRLIKQ